MIRRLEIKITQPVSRSYAGSWEHFFLENREVGKSGVYFPNLEWLVLDIQEWNIQKDHFLVVCYSRIEQSRSDDRCTDNIHPFFSRFSRLPQFSEARWV